MSTVFCPAKGCLNTPDPRWFAHAADGHLVPICDGHKGTPCKGTPCTCPEIDELRYSAEITLSTLDLRTLRSVIREGLERCEEGILAAQYRIAEGESEAWERLEFWRARQKHQQELLALFQKTFGESAWPK
jgi:hypothetical protein